MNGQLICHLTIFLFVEESNSNYELLEMSSGRSKTKLREEDLREVEHYFRSKQENCILD